MSPNPYENEPGFEEANEVSDKKNQKDYVQKIRHESLRISIIQRMEEFMGIGNVGYGNRSTDMFSRAAFPTIDLEGLDEATVPFEPFKDLCKRRFLWYYDSYMSSIQKGKKEVRDNQPFTRMPFEGISNAMEGKFNYTDLEWRLAAVKKALDDERTQWAATGESVRDQDATVAVNLQRQFEQVVEAFKRHGIPHNIELEDGNPFVWVVTYFGKPMTNLDGGLFRFRLHLSPRFPEEQPRARFETHIFHHRIAADGTPCYVVPPNRREDVKSHIEAIIDTLEEESPPYDPRALVNPEAHKLYWGSADDRKQYNRRLRRTVQQSVE